MAWDQHDWVIPSELVPVAELLGVHWPDISENAVYDLGAAFFDFGNAVNELGLSVADQLAELNRANSSAALQSLENDWRWVQQHVIDPVVTATTDAQRACDDAYDIVHTYKATLLGYIDAQFLPGGVGWTLASKTVARRAAALFVEHEAEKTMAQLSAKFSHALTTKVQDVIHARLQQSLSLGAMKVDTVLDKAVRPLTLDSLQTQLVISAESLEHATAKIEQRYDDISAAAKELANAHVRSDYKGRSPAASDPSVRQWIESVLESCIPDVTATVEQIAQHLLSRLVGNITAVHDQVSVADELLASRSSTTA